MAYFTKEDFKGVTAQRLNVIINHKMGLSPLTSFHDLIESRKTKFNKLLNEYIKTNLGDFVNWQEILEKEFNEIVLEEVLNENYNPSKEPVPLLNTERELLLSKEQKDFLENDPEAIQFDFSKDYKVILPTE